MNIGIFSGSFNPIHIGHLALANYLCEYGDLDEVWFMVTPHNPLKEENELMDDKLRLKLVQLATEGYPKFRASDFEFHLPRPSYTVHTLDALKRTYPQHTFHLVIGSDNWRLFHRWYKSERILAENHLLVLTCDDEARQARLTESPFDSRVIGLYDFRSHHRVDFDASPVDEYHFGTAVVFEYLSLQARESQRAQGRCRA